MSQNAKVFPVQNDDSTPTVGSESQLSAIFRQDSEATFSPRAPAVDQIYPQGTPVENFGAERGGFFNFEATPSSDARPENFYHYSTSGGVFIVCFQASLSCRTQDYDQDI